MYFLKFILLLLIPSYISGGCHPNITVSGGQNVCSGQDFNVTCQFTCHGLKNHVNLLKEQQLYHTLESSNNSITLSIQVHSANRDDSGRYICQTKPEDQISIADVMVEDCVSPSNYLSTVNTTPSSLSTKYQRSTPSSILDPVLIWYILFKTGVFLIGSIAAALKIRSTEK